MAAVAADPGAAAVPTPTATAAADHEAPPEPGPAVRSSAEPAMGPGGPQESSPAAERAEDGGDAEAHHVRPELEPSAGAASPGGGGSDHPSDRFSPGLPADPYRSIPPDPQPHAVFLHSFPAPPPVSEAGLSLAEPAEPSRAEPGDRDRGYTALLRSGPPQDGAADRPEPPQPCRPDPVLLDLSPGSEVRVSLDHVIDDALVVSFRRGEKVFSGVLMDISRR